MKRKLVALGFAVIFIIPGFQCLADGIFKGSVNAVPGIPYQAGIVRYKDGEETLVIQSYLEAEEGENFGWIIPLPEKPTVIEEFPPGMFKTLFFCFDPYVEYMQDRVIGLFIFVIFFLFPSIVILRTSLKLKTCIRIIEILALFSVIMNFPSFSLKCYNGAKSEVAFPEFLTRVVDLQTGVDKTYELDVLKIEDVATFSKWLKNKGFSDLKPQERRIISEYIKKEWVFVVARFQGKKTDKYLAPPPLQIRFQTDKPVYPLRLTGCASKPPDFHLFVIAREKAISPGLKVLISNTMGKGKNGLWRGNTFWRQIGHESFLPLLWEGCVLTVLYAPKNKKISSKDLYLKFTEKKPHRETLYPNTGAQIRRYFASFSICTFLLFLYHLVWRIRKKKWNIDKYVMVVYLLLFIVLVVVFTPVFPSLKDVNMKEMRIRFYDDWYAKGVAELIAINLNIRYQGEFSKKEIIEKIGKLEELSVNVITKKKMIYEASPGNFTLHKNPRGQWIISTYDNYGRRFDQEM